MWTSTVGFVNGKHRYLTAETFGFKINSNGQVLGKRQQWTLEPFPENLGPDGSISSAASVSSQCVQPLPHQLPMDLIDPTLTWPGPAWVSPSPTSVKSSSTSSSSASETGSTGGTEDHENVAIKSHLNKYLAVDSFGNVTCDSDEKTETARFTITICSMSQGRNKQEQIFWAFKNVERGYYLGTTDDGMICCNAKIPRSRAELWHLHLIPARGASFFAIRSFGRKRFARLVDEHSVRQYQTLDRAELGRSSAVANWLQGGGGSSGGQVQIDATISWGSETLFQLKYFAGGHYSLLTHDCMYLTNEGNCITWTAPATKGEDSTSLPPLECLFTLEYHSGFLAFRDSSGNYLAAAGRSSVLRSRSPGVSRDELFVFESAPIQVSLKATFNNRWVSIKQGMDLSANQRETATNFEIFQLTYHKETENWSIMTHECNFWTVLPNSCSISVCKPGDYEALDRGQFKLEWSDLDASCALKFVNDDQQERWICARKSGQLFLAGPNQPPVRFIMRFQNRKLLNLRPVDRSGFVGLKANQLDASKTSPDLFEIEYFDQNLPAVSLPGAGNGPHQTPSSDGISKNNSATDLIQFDRDCSPPAVGPKPTSAGSKTGQPTINMFNVRLNSTKMSSQSVLDRFNGNEAAAAAAQRQQQQYSHLIDAEQQQDNGRRHQRHRHELSDLSEEIDFGVDKNNNCTLLPGKDHCKAAGGEQAEGTATTATSKITETTNGNVESAPAPSVASIINSFSSTKIRNQSADQMVTSVGASSGKAPGSQHLTTPVGRVSSSVFKLASSFNANAPLNQEQQQQQHIGGAASDTASVITSCSGSSSVLSSPSSGGSTTAVAAASDNDQAVIVPEASDKVAQFECCYLKSVSNNMYLITKNTDSSILCAATNRACAQSWIIELRTHNSIAIRASDNFAYMQLGTNGVIYLAKCDPEQASLWEF